MVNQLLKILEYLLSRTYPIYRVDPVRASTWHVRDSLEIC